MRCEAHAKTKGDGTWEPVTAPFACSYYAVLAATGTTFDKCSNADGSGCVLDALTGFPVTATPPRWSYSRWDEGEVITYVRSSVPLNLYFLK